MRVRWALPLIACSVGCDNDPVPCVCEGTVLAAGLIGGGAIATDGTMVYWAESGLVRAVANDGGPITTVTPVRVADELQWSAGMLAWVDDTTVRTWVLPDGPGGTVNTEPASVPSYGFAIDATHVALPMQSSDLVRVPLDGGAATTLATGVWALDVAANETDAFFTACFDGVSRVPLGGGSPVRLAAGFCPIRLAINSQALFWADSTEEDPERDHLSRVALDGGEVTTLVDQLQPGEGGVHLEVDEDHVYYTTGYALWRVPTGGGEHVKLAEGEIDTLAVDDTSVYWIDTEAGTIWKAPK